MFLSFSSLCEIKYKKDNTWHIAKIYRPNFVSLSLNSQICLSNLSCLLSIAVNLGSSSLAGDALLEERDGWRSKGLRN